MSEVHDEYSESLELGFRELQGALLGDTVQLLGPTEPLRFTAEVTVEEAIAQMVKSRRASVVIVDAAGRLIGIFTERDVLTSVVGQRRDIRQTRLGEVMTRDPEALSPQDRICYAVNRMNIAGYRTIPLVDDKRRPVGIVTVNDVIRWLAEIFPEAVLNLRPGDEIKRPLQVDAG